MLDVKTLNAGKVGTTQIDATPFEGRANPVVMREAVLMYEARKRVGTASTKTRAEIKGSTKKIYRQKGSGNARHGNSKAPSFRGGGVAHGPKPRDYSYSLPRKALKRALKLALAGKLRDGEVLRWEGQPIQGEKPSTKAFRLGLEALEATPSALIVASAAVEPSLLLSARNLPKVRVLPAAEISAYDVLSHRWMVLLDGAYEALKTRLDLDEEGSAS